MTYETPNPKSFPLAIISMIAGILSLILILVGFCVLPIVNSLIGIILGTAALIMGLVAKKKIREAQGLNAQLKIANAGFILGIVAIGLGLTGLAVGIITKFVLAGPAIENLFNEIIESLE